MRLKQVKCHEGSEETIICVQALELEVCISQLCPCQAEGSAGAMLRKLRVAWGKLECQPHPGSNATFASQLACSACSALSLASSGVHGHEEEVWTVRLL